MDDLVAAVIGVNDGFPDVRVVDVGTGQAAVGGASESVMSLWNRQMSSYTSAMKYRRLWVFFQPTAERRT